MTASGPSLGGSDYVVRYGLRGFRGALCGLLVWTGLACVIAAYDAAPSVPIAIALAVGETGLLAACGVDIWRAARRDVIFAVHADGVYFGSGPMREDVPWELISEVELFTERASSHGIRTRFRCVGVRAPVASNGRGDRGAARPRAERGRDRGSVLEASLTGRRPATGETIRLAYRRMRGWRVNRARLAAAVRRHAPDVAVVHYRA